MDFNPYRIRREWSGATQLDKDGRENLGEKRSTRLVAEPSIITLPAIFREPFTTALPYRETLVPNVLVPTQGSLMLDDERVLIFDVSAPQLERP